mmetsp:Transcript_19298/g.58285  ORF Transcript_19298/g.58285 Transcript_19298/m.58285 type:complete len:391 (-) Transcript_19298:2914-4086(-)
MGRSRSRSPRERSRDRKEKSSKRRSRSREKRSRRSGSPPARRSRFDAPPEDPVAAMQQAQLAALQQQQLQKQLLAQQQLMQQQAMSMPGGLNNNKKQREIYVGNLTIGVVTEQLLSDLFNAALIHLVPDAGGNLPAPGTATDFRNHPNPPVVAVRLDATGRFGFVEMRTEDLSFHAMALDKVDLCGRQINVGRPKGYIEADAGPPPAAIGAAAAFAAQLAAQPTPILRLDNIVKAHTLLNRAEIADLITDVTEEAQKYGEVVAVAVPPPPNTITALDPGRCYIKFAETHQAEAAYEAMHTRTFDDNVISAKYASEMDFVHASAGVWDAGTGYSTLTAGMPSNMGMALPGMGPMMPGMPMSGLIAGAPGPGMAGMPMQLPGSLPGPPPMPR